MQLYPEIQQDVARIVEREVEDAEWTTDPVQELGLATTNIGRSIGEREASQRAKRAHT